MKKCYVKAMIVSVIAIIIAFVGAICNYAYKVNGETMNLVSIMEFEERKEAASPVVFSDEGSLNQCFRYEVAPYEFDPIKDLGKDISITWSINFDEQMFKEIIYELNSKATKSVDAYLDDEDNIVDEIYGTQIDENAALSLAKNAVVNPMTFEVKELSEAYIKPEVTAEKLTAAKEKRNKLRKWSISYAGHGISIKAPADAIIINDKGEVEIIDTSFIDDFVDNVLDPKFTTVGKAKEFTTHDGKEIVVNGGTFGNVVDKEREKEFLKDCFKKNISGSARTPFYEKEDGATIGSNYVEVSIADQHVWVHKDGNILMDSDCVTGCVAKNNNTPKGTWYVYEVATNRTLKPKGATTGSFVERWMPFTPDGCGLHDASWRGSFGGNIYKSNGSHGCVNLPKKFAKALFEEAYVGIPVVVY